MFHSEIVIKHGMATVLDSMVKQRAGLVSVFCLPVIVVGVVAVAVVVVGGGGGGGGGVLFSLQYTTAGHKSNVIPQQLDQKQINWLGKSFPSASHCRLVLLMLLLLLLLLLLFGYNTRLLDTKTTYHNSSTKADKLAW